MDEPSGKQPGNAASIGDSRAWPAIHEAKPGRRPGAHGRDQGHAAAALGGGVRWKLDIAVLHIALEGQFGPTEAVALARKRIKEVTCCVRHSGLLPGMRGIAPFRRCHTAFRLDTAHECNVAQYPRTLLRGHL